MTTINIGSDILNAFRNAELKTDEFIDFKKRFFPKEPKINMNFPLPRNRVLSREEKVAVIQQGLKGVPPDATAEEIADAINGEIQPLFEQTYFDGERDFDEPHFGFGQGHIYDDDDKNLFGGNNDDVRGSYNQSGSFETTKPKKRGFKAAKIGDPIKIEEIDIAERQRIADEARRESEERLAKEIAETEKKLTQEKEELVAEKDKTEAELRKEREERLRIVREQDERKKEEQRQNRIFFDATELIRSRGSKYVVKTFDKDGNVQASTIIRKKGDFDKLFRGKDVRVQTSSTSLDFLEGQNIFTRQFNANVIGPNQLRTNRGLLQIDQITKLQSAERALKEKNMVNNDKFAELVANKPEIKRTVKEGKIVTLSKPLSKKAAKKKD